MLVKYKLTKNDNNLRGTAPEALHCRKYNEKMKFCLLWIEENATLKP